MGRKECPPAKRQFGATLRAWREEAGATQESLGLASGKGRSWVGQFESGQGTAAIPDRSTCAQIAEYLQRDPEEVWRTVAPLRLRARDPDLADFMESELEAARGELSEEEQALILHLRSLERRPPWQGIAGPLLAFLRAAAQSKDELGGKAPLYQVLTESAKLDIYMQGDVLRAFLAIVRTVGRGR